MAERTKEKIDNKIIEIAIEALQSDDEIGMCTREVIIDHIDAQDAEIKQQAKTIEQMRAMDRDLPDCAEYCPEIKRALNEQRVKHAGLIDELRRQQEVVAEKYKRRLQAMMPLFQEARDAICAIPKTAAKLRGLRLDLADRMDDVGIAERWAAREAAQAAAETDNK